MSRSYKKNIYKDKGMAASIYWRTIRRKWRQQIRVGDYELLHPRTIINDYDYSEYRLDFRYMRCFYDNVYRKGKHTISK